MMPLFRVFAGISVKVAAFYVVASIVGILALDRMFGGYEFYLGMLVFIAPLISWALARMCVPKNLDWIMALPISKRNVLVLNYATGLFANAVIFLASVFVLLVLGVLKADQHVSVRQIARNAPNMVPEAKLGPYVAGIDIYGWMTGLLMLCFFHALSMSISRPLHTKRFYLNLWNHMNPVVRWGVRIGWVAAIGLVGLFREFALAPFGIFMIATFAFLFITTVNTAHALAIPKTQRNRWLLGSGAVVAAQVAFLFAHAMNGVRSESFDRRVASVMFLGPFSGGLSKSDMARLLEADINHERLEELGEVYRKRYHGGKKVRPSLDRDLSFTRAIATKRTFSDVIASMHLFDLAELGASDLQALFAKVQPLMNECRCEFPTLELLASPVDATPFLGASEDVAVSYALLWARFRARPGDKRVAAAIERRLAKYPDRLKLSALLSLSVLEGRRYSLNDWIARGQGRALSSESFTVDCSKWSIKSVAGIEAKDIPQINACVRQRADLAHVGEIEAAGWIVPPLDAKTRATIRKVLKIR